MVDIAAESVLHTSGNRHVASGGETCYRLRTKHPASESPGRLEERQPVAAKTSELESRLDSFDRAQRDQALDDLLRLVDRGHITLPEPEAKVNLHAHSFYSFNALGYSPTHIVWRARREALRAVGLVDFDVLDGIDEFFRAGRLLGIPTVAGLETRAYIPEFATREINSPAACSRHPRVRSLKAPPTSS